MMIKNFNKTERVLKALANRRRLAILSYLKKKREAHVGDIADQIKLSFKATSKHLTVLSAAELLEREQRSSQMYYKIAAELPAEAKVVIRIL